MHTMGFFILSLTEAEALVTVLLEARLLQILVTYCIGYQVQEV